MKTFLLSTLPLVSASVLACTCGAGRISEPAANAAAGLFAGIQYDYAHGERLNVDKDEVSNPFGNRIHTHRATLTVGYALNETFSLLAAPQQVTRAYRRTPVDMMGMQAAPTQSGVESGLGDTLVALLAKHTPVKGETRLTVGALLGVETPTGDSDFLAAPGGMNIHMTGVHNSMLALGSGSWDPVAGVSADLEHGAWAGSASLRRQWNTEGRAGFRYGDATTWDMEAGAKVLQGATTVTVLLGAAGTHLTDNEKAGVRADGTSGDHVYAGPRLRVGFRDGVSLNAGVGLPVYVRTDDGGMGGPHIADSWNANFGVTCAF